MNFKENESATKLRGGYYTPDDVAQFLTRWVLKKCPKTILEPSCGDGAFIRALNKKHNYSIHLTAIELNKEEAEKAKAVSKNNKLLQAEIKNEDFLWWALNTNNQYEAILGNPPYIRYQYLEKKDQELSEKIFKKHQLHFTKHTNAWVPFVIASIDLLIPGGRLAMVIPSELLHVLHATSLREHLINVCDRILLIDPNELLFSEALQGTLLLMVEKKEDPDSSSSVAITSVINKDFLKKNPDDYFKTANYVSGDILIGKWMKVLLEPEELDVFERVRSLPMIRQFKDIAEVDVGIVTGANKFFLVDAATVQQYGLEQYSHPMFGRSEHCPGVIYDKKTHGANVKNGYPSSFLFFNTDDSIEKLPSLIQDYIKLGESQELHKRYKCRIRKPWYVVPSVYATSIGMLKRSHQFPRLIFNSIKAYTTDTAYRIQTISPDIPPEKLVYSFINSLTALTAELEGRHYGGGVLELVPSEIEKLLIPMPKLDKFDLKNLDAKIRSSESAELLLQQQDQIVLVNAGVTKKDVKILNKAWIRIRKRRHRLLEQKDI